MDLIAGPISMILDIFSLIMNSSLNYGPICRIFKLLTTHENRHFLANLLEIIPTFLPMLILILFITYYYAFYATLLMQGLDEKGYFRTFGQSYMSLIQIMTLDSWGEIYYTLQESSSRGSSVWTTVFFVSYILIVGVFLTNVFIGIVAYSAEPIA